MFMWRSRVGKDPRLLFQRAKQPSGNPSTRPLQTNRNSGRVHLYIKRTHTLVRLSILYMSITVA